MSRRIALGLVAVLAMTAIGASVDATMPDGLPPYLTDANHLPADVRADVESIWQRRTLSRTLVGPAARGPLDFYRLLIDTPEITMPAGEHLGLARYQVTRLGEDRYSVEANDGTRGTYRVVQRNARERVMIAHVERTTRVLGRVRGASLARLTFAPVAGADQIRQEVETTVRIDHRVVAFIARVLVPLFPSYADRKIGELFEIAARVSQWGHDAPAAFCDWIAAQPDGARQREVFARALPGCEASAAR